MKKKIIFGSLFAVVFVLSIFFKTKPNQNIQQASIDPSVLISWTDDINLGASNCVCKGGSCSEANWVSFRKFCGNTTGGQAGNTNFACAGVDNGACK